MNASGCIKSQEFFNAFIAEWQKLMSSEDISGSSPFTNRPDWTKRMLKKDGILNGVMNQLSTKESPLFYRTEWYSVDALFVGGENLYQNDHTYPSAVQVIVEHEFGEDVEREMWKLIHWRSPLKVIINYDWADTEKTTENRRLYLKRKLDNLRGMLNKVNQFHPECETTEYLFLVARRETESSPIAWQRFDLGLDVETPYLE